MNTKLQNRELSQLINGNALINLPGVELISNNAEINRLQNCTSTAVFLGRDPNVNYTSICHTRCGSNGQLLEVSETDEYYLNDIRLTPGFWCTLIMPICNMNTSKVLFTPNGYTCRSRFPRLFGGPTGSVIVACSDEFTNGGASQLWDNVLNEPVDVNTVNISHEDELLPDGNFRFTCRYADDEQGNQLIPHPLSRFNPIRDYCLIGTPFAHRSAHIEVTENSYHCNCGDPNITRIQNEISSDSQSRCTSCPHLISGNRYNLGYRCFRMGSSFLDVMSYPPCLSENFTVLGNDCETTSFKITIPDGPAPLHPVITDQQSVESRTIVWD